jgi:hemerythrin
MTSLKSKLYLLICTVAIVPMAFAGVYLLIPMPDMVRITLIIIFMIFEVSILMVSLSKVKDLLRRLCISFTAINDMLDGKFHLDIESEGTDEAGQLITSVIALNNTMHQLFNGSAVAMRVVDKDYKIILQNEAMAKMSGWDDGKSIGIRCDEQLKGAACEDSSTCTLDRVMNGDDLIQGEIDKTAPDGRVIPTALTAKPYKDLDGNVIGVIETFMDISELKNKNESAENVLKEVIGTTDALNEAIQIVLSTNESVVANTKEVTETMDSMADGAQDQSQQVSDAAAKVNTLMMSVKDVVSNSSESAVEAKSASEAANVGAKLSAKAGQQMASISTAVNESATIISQLGEKSMEIGKIVDVINQISDQTNLLALNAAIEAARAGDAGKGFAVVADEVRKLAEESSSATQQIGEIIKEIQGQTQDVIKSMDEGVKEVDNGSKVVSDVLDSLNVIDNAVVQVTNRVNEISSSAQSQLREAEQVNDSMMQISSIAEANAAGSEQVTASITEVNESMKNVAKQLTQVSDLSSSLQTSVLSSTSEKIVWGPKMMVGLKTVDAHHKKLFDLIEDLKNASTKAALENVFVGLVEFVDFHFSYEEDIFAKFSFKDEASHVKKHRAFVNGVISKKESFDKGSINILDIYDFLLLWLKEHIQGTDVEFVPFMKKNGIS